MTENITVDGVIDATGNWFAPSGAQDPEDIAELTTVETELRRTADALLVGRITFEAFREYWPRQTEDVTGVSDYLNGVQKYVFSRTMADPRWDNSQVLRGPLGDEVAALKEQPGGDGARLFDGATGIGQLELIGTRSFRSGITLMRYRTLS